MPLEITGQVLSIIGMVLTVLSFQMKTKKQILTAQTLGSLFFLISFFFLGSFAAVYLNIVFLVRNTVFYFAGDKKWAKHPLWLPVLIVAVTVAGALGLQSAWDLLPIIGSIFGTFAAYVKNENMLRLIKLGDSPCWLVYNASVPSVGGVVCEVFNMVSIIVGIVRYRKSGILADGREGEGSSD